MRLRSAFVNRTVAVLLLVCLIIGWPGSLAVRQAGATPASAPQAASEPYDVQAFLDRQPGVLKSYREGRYRAAQVIEGYATYYNLDPRILLALLELVPGLVTDPAPPEETLARPFGVDGPNGFAAQIDWVSREVRAGFGPYDKAPEVRFSDGGTTVLPLNQDPSVVAIQRLLARGRAEADWRVLKDGYEPLFVRLFGQKPETVTPSPTIATGRPFLRLPWASVYPNVAGDPLAGKPVRMTHSSYFDHVYPTVDLGSDGNDFIVTYDNRGAVSYNSHDANDYYFNDRPTGTPIVAAADGMAYAYTARGNGVVIRHGGAFAGYETVYWHMDALEQKFDGNIDTGVGVPVQAGDYLGTSGKTGFVVGGAHLHFEVRRNGRQVDPYGWFGPGEDPCAAWVAGCEASVWLWDDSLRGQYDFTPPNAPAPLDTDPPVASVSVVTDPDLSLLLRFDDQPVPQIGHGSPTLGGTAGVDLAYEAGVFGQAVRVPSELSLSYPISNNLALDAGTLALWAKIPEQYPRNGTERNYVLAASNNPGDSKNGVYTETLALRREGGDENPQWNFWTVDGAGLRHDLLVTDTLKAGWHHFAISWDQEGADTLGTKKLFIDGVLAGSATAVPMPAFVGDKLELGRWTPGYGASDMALDELAVFRRELSGTEVTRLADRRDYLSGEPGPIGAQSVTSSRSVELDTNAIDRQGGVVSVRLRRDDEPWGQPIPYYDSYRWSITGTDGLHTFAVEFRDRAENATVVTTTVVLASPPTASPMISSTRGMTSTIRLDWSGDKPEAFQISSRSDFGDAEWQPFTEGADWRWPAARRRIAYVRFRSEEGLIGPTQLIGLGADRQFFPMLTSNNP